MAAVSTTGPWKGWRRRAMCWRSGWALPPRRSPPCRAARMTAGSTGSSPRKRRWRSIPANIGPSWYLIGWDDGRARARARRRGRAGAMRWLFLGDIVGRSGREALLEQLPRLRRELALDFVVVNGENAAGGFGITEKLCAEFYAAGTDVITTGNHVWDQKETVG